MQYLIKKLLFFPLVVFIIFFIIFSITLKNKLTDYFNEFFNNRIQYVIENTKKDLKYRADNVAIYIDLLYKESFKTILHHDYLHISSLYKIYSSLSEKDKKEFLKKFYTDKQFLIVVKNNDLKNLEDKYFLVLEDFNNIKFGFAISKEYIINSINKDLFKYLDKINHNSKYYIAIVKITTFNIDKKGVFGEIYYMPPGLRENIGKKLSIYDKDKKGNLFRKAYFEKIKRGEDSFFLKYYYINPRTSKIEEKISYFKYLRKYNLLIVSGFYKSDIIEELENNKKNMHAFLSHVMLNIYYTLIILTFISLFIIFIYSKKLLKLIEEDYKKIKKSFEQSQRDLEHRLYYDILTNLPNRMKLLEDIENYHSLILIDIDNFSLLNDIYGFDFGDKLLIYISNILKRKFVNVYRVGSDEFVIASIFHIDESSLENIALIHIMFEGINISLTVGGSNREDDLLRTSELALRKARSLKNKKYYLYNNTLFNEQKENIEKIEFLKNVLRKNSIYPYYQCIVDKDRKVIKYEALMRIVYEDKVYSPFFFLDFIKKAKIYDQFSRIMIKRVVDDIKAGLVDNVSINISFEDIVNLSTQEFVYYIIDEEVANKVTIEILESEGIEDYNKVSEFLNRLRKKGVKVAIDDFGSGYSNFVQILKIEPDYIKIDASLVKNLDDEHYLEIIDLIVKFAKKFNIKTVAEFVDNEEKFEKLKKLGVDYFQGYYFCTPEDLSKNHST